MKRIFFFEIFCFSPFLYNYLVDLQHKFRFLWINLVNFGMTKKTKTIATPTATQQQPTVIHIRQVATACVPVRHLKTIHSVSIHSHRRHVLWKQKKTCRPLARQFRSRLDNKSRGNRSLALLIAVYQCAKMNCWKTLLCQRKHCYFQIVKLLFLTKLRKKIFSVDCDDENSPTFWLDMCGTIDDEGDATSNSDYINLRKNPEVWNFFFFFENVKKKNCYYYSSDILDIMDHKYGKQCMKKIVFLALVMLKICVMRFVFFLFFLKFIYLQCFFFQIGTSFVSIIIWITCIN